MDVINIIILVGKSATGKDSIARELERLGYHKIVTTTTRPKRDGEIDGISYNFISTDKFLKKYIDNEFLEVNYFDTEQGLWFYGSPLVSYQNADDKTICILDPNGLKKIIANNIPHMAILIYVSDDEIKKRQIERGDSETEAKRRFEADKKDFEDIANYVSYKVCNDKNVKEVAKEIDLLYRRDCD